MKSILDILLQTVIKPIVETANFAGTDKTTVQTAILSVTAFELVENIQGHLTPSLVEECKSKLLDGEVPENLNKLFSAEIERNSALRNAIAEYLENQFPDFITSLVNSYIQKASPEEKERMEKAVTKVIEDLKTVFDEEE